MLIDLYRLKDIHVQPDSPLNTSGVTSKWSFKTVSILKVKRRICLLYCLAFDVKMPRDTTIYAIYGWKRLFSNKAIDSLWSIFESRLVFAHERGKH